MARLIASAFALVTIAVAASAGPARAADAITVMYRAPLVTLDARDAPLGTVLAEVGAKAGFTVVQAGGAPRRITISIQDATVDDVLRQLLRSENHTLLYRAQPDQPGGVLDQVVLLGTAPAASVASAPPSRPNPAGAPQPAGAQSPLAAPNPLTAPYAPSAAPAPSDDAEPTVSDVLRSHATATLQAAEAARTAAPAAEPASGPAPPADPRSIQLTPEAQDALAATTRQAQQSLKALVDGLDAATQALQQQQSQPQPQKTGPLQAPAPAAPQPPALRR